MRLNERWTWCNLQKHVTRVAIMWVLWFSLPKSLPWIYRQSFSGLASCEVGRCLQLPYLSNCNGLLCCRNVTACCALPNTTHVLIKIRTLRSWMERCLLCVVFPRIGTSNSNKTVLVCLSNVEPVSWIISLLWPLTSKAPLVCADTKAKESDTKTSEPRRRGLKVDIHSIHIAYFISSVYIYICNYIWWNFLLSDHQQIPILF